MDFERSARFPIAAMAVLALVSRPAAFSFGAETRWQAGAGDWFEPANWDNGVPGLTDPRLGWIDHGGEAAISSGTAAVVQLHVGSDGNGAVIQSLGANAIVHYLDLGEEVGMEGSYPVSYTHLRAHET